MAGYVKGSRTHLAKLVGIIAKECEKLNERSPENEENTEKILDSLEQIIKHFAAAGVAVNQDGMHWGKREKPIEESDN